MPSTAAYRSIGDEEKSSYGGLLQEFESSLRGAREAVVKMVALHEQQITAERKELIARRAENEELNRRVEILEERLEDAHGKIHDMVSSLQRLQQFKRQVYDSFVEDTTLLSDIVRKAGTGVREDYSRGLKTCGSVNDGAIYDTRSRITTNIDLETRTTATSDEPKAKYWGQVESAVAAANESQHRTSPMTELAPAQLLGGDQTREKSYVSRNERTKYDLTQNELVAKQPRVESAGKGQLTGFSSTDSELHILSRFMHDCGVSTVPTSSNSVTVSATPFSSRLNSNYRSAQATFGGVSHPVEVKNSGDVLQHEMCAVGAVAASSQSGSSTTITLTNEPLNSEKKTLPEAVPSPPPFTVDGREFFKAARAQLSYDDFTQLLNNVKAFNARMQSKSRTLENLYRIFGTRHPDLYQRFEKIVCVASPYDSGSGGA